MKVWTHTYSEKIIWIKSTIFISLQSSLEKLFEIYNKIKSNIKVKENLFGELDSKSNFSDYLQTANSYFKLVEYGPYG